MRLQLLLLCHLFIFLATVLCKDNQEHDNVDIFPPLPLEIIADDSLCEKQSGLFLNGLKNFTLWAHQMRDATGKSVTGILTGNIFHLGQFQECLSSQAPFSTQYCLTSIKAKVIPPDPPRDPKSLYYEPNESVLRKIYDHKDPSQISKNNIFYGWCVPASCSPQQLTKSLNKYLAEFNKTNISYEARVSAEGCQEKNERSRFDRLDMSFISIVMFLAIVMIMSTTYDNYVTSSTENKLKETITYKCGSSWSVIKNFNSLSKYDDSNPALHVLYGMRTLSICMIIINHRFGTYLSVAVLNFDFVERNYRSISGSIFFHGDLFVDSFFVLSGILVTYSLLLQYSKKIINPALVIFLRYIRLTPTYAFVVFYYATLFNFVSSGPFWKMTVSQESLDCRQSWWLNLLYINNYVNVNHMCMAQSWFLPCDFHYFIIALLVCILINKRKIIGISALAVIVILSVLIPFLLTLLNKEPAILHFYTEFLTAPKSHPYFNSTYIKSHIRAAPYFIGMIAGYIYYKMRSTSGKICIVKSYAIFLVSLIGILIILLTGVIFNNPYYKYNALESATYAALNRTIWAIGSVGVLYVASYGHSTFIYKILSWKPWIPLSKLVYGVYLIHMQFQIISVAKKSSSTVVSYYDLIYLGLSDIFISFGAALILYLAIEAPFRNIFNLLLYSHKKDTKREKINSENH